MADDPNGAMSCADMAKEVMHSEYTQAAADLAGGAMAVWGPGHGVNGVLENAGRGDVIHEYGPAAAGTVFYGACAPIETAEEYGHAIGTSLHDLGVTAHDYFSPPSTPPELPGGPSHFMDPPAAPAPDAFGHPDAFAGAHADSFAGSHADAFAGAHANVSGGGHADAGGGHGGGSHDGGGGSHDGGMGGSI